MKRLMRVTPRDHRDAHGPEGRWRPRRSGSSSPSAQAPAPPAVSHGFAAIDLADHHYLKSLHGIFTEPNAELFVDHRNGEQALSRLNQQGLIMAVGRVGSHRLAVVLSDFRVNGASYSKASSQRLVHFLAHLKRAGLPCFFVIQTLGVCLMEGRAVFSDAFRIWPALLDYARTNTLVTCAVGKCLGLGAVLFGLGHYRMAVAAKTHLNLTGPEVLKMFFGQAFDFAHCASAERQLETTDLVHELVDGVESAAAKMRTLLFAEPRQAFTGGPDARPLRLLSRIGEVELEVFPGSSKPLRAFLMRRGAARFGVFITPPGRAANLICARTLQTYAAGLDLFCALGLPVVSMLDAPGIDPRFEQSDRNNIRLMLAVGERIIDYPHGAMGIVIGRCFGGATSLAFPKVFGAQRVIALEGSQLGAMHPKLIEKLLDKSPRLLAQWTTVARAHQADLSDLVADGAIDAVVSEEALGTEVDRFLTGLLAPATGARH